MAYQDMWNELAARVPGLSPFLSQKFINRGWADIRNTRAWSFLFQPAFFQAPPVILDGTVTVTTGSTTVVPDATAAAALQAAHVAANPPLESRQFRVDMAGAVYSIASWTAPSGPLVLSQAYQDPTVAGASYAVYQCYFPPPTPDFIRWVSIYDPDNGYAFTKLHGSEQILNRMDPTRSNDGLAYWCVDYAADAVGNPLFEFWPHPTQGQNYVALYQRRGVNFSSPSDTPPLMIEEGLIVDRALRYAYVWAMTNSARFPQLGGARGINWAFLKQDADKQFQVDLQRAKRLDDDVRLNSLVITEKATYTGPLDAKFLQSHDVGWYGWP